MPRIAATAITAKSTISYHKGTQRRATGRTRTTAPETYVGTRHPHRSLIRGATASNSRSAPRLISHFFFAWCGAFLSVVFGDVPGRPNPAALWRAFLQLPGAIRSRWLARALARISDTEAFQPRLAPGDLPQHALIDVFLRLQERRHGALHVAALDHALVLPRGRHHLGPFVEPGAGGLFHVNVLAGFAGFHSHVGVPVVRGTDANGVDGPGGH